MKRLGQISRSRSIKRSNSHNWLSKIWVVVEFADFINTSWDVAVSDYLVILLHVKRKPVTYSSIVSFDKNESKRHRKSLKVSRLKKNKKISKIHSNENT